MASMNHNMVHFHFVRYPMLESTKRMLIQRAGILLLATCCSCFAVVEFPKIALSAQPRPVVGESYIFNNSKGAETRSEPASNSSASQGGAELPSPYTAQSPSPDILLRREPSQQQPSVAELLDPDSRPWASAPALLLRRRHAEAKLAENVLAADGDGNAAAASLFDGTILLYGTNAQCTNPGALSMPNGHPAFALAMAPRAETVAAWAPGKGEAVLFDLSRQGCPVSLLRAPLVGDVTMKLSASGSILVAKDGEGMLWGGVRPDPGETKRLFKMGIVPQHLIIFSLSQNEGVLALVDAQGNGTIWNPRSGKLLRSFEVKGGPFVSGQLVNETVVLRTAENSFIKWDILHNSAVVEKSDEQLSPVSEQDRQAQQPSKGRLELRGTTLFYVGERRGWRVSPLYEQQNISTLLSLNHSTTTECLRLRDVDGEVRYYSSKTGLPKAQCFADDWSIVRIQQDGSAHIPGLSLRIFEPLQAGPKGSKLNVRALSRGVAYVWRSDFAQTQDNAEERIEGKSSALLEPVVEKEQDLVIPLRQGLSAAEETQQLSLSRRAQE